MKARLRALADEARQDDALIRIACRELESWILGDLRAVGLAYDKPDLKAQTEGNLSECDGSTNFVEELRKFVPLYQKRDGARRVDVLLKKSGEQPLGELQRFCEGVLRLVGDGPATG